MSPLRQQMLDAMELRAGHPLSGDGSAWKSRLQRGFRRQYSFRWGKKARDTCLGGVKPGERLSLVRTGPPVYAASNDRSTTDGVDALPVCQIAMKDRLKSPTTAQFSTDYRAGDLGDGRWQIVSSVDSQNSFGAMLRTKFSCHLQHLSGSAMKMENWKIELILTE